MKNILEPEEAVILSKELKDQNKIIVLVGGCFDILHVGHVRFLENARNQGDVLLLLLESDENVRRLKGEGRPINPQLDRAKVLSSLQTVDYVVLLPNMKSDEDYDKLISHIKPNVLATTKNDAGIRHKKRQAKMINGKTKEVIRRIEGKSTTNLNNILKDK